VRIVVVTDSHLSPSAIALNDNWSAARRFIASAHADLTIHLGDITVDGLEDPAQFQHAQRISANWPTPIRWLPGNHDIGDNPPGPGVVAKEPLRLPRLVDFRAAFGADYWRFDADEFRLIGLNAQLMGMATAEEAEQWSWVEAQLADARHAPLVIFLHKPLFQDSPLDARPHQRYVPSGPRRRLFDLLPPGALRAVVSGHTHQYRDRIVDGVRHIWVPSTAFYLPDELQDRVGEKITGLGVLDLARGALRFDLVCPDGMSRHSALDHPVYPKHVEARARLAARAPTGV